MRIKLRTNCKFFSKKFLNRKIFHYYFVSFGMEIRVGHKFSVQRAGGALRRSTRERCALTFEPFLSIECYASVCIEYSSAFIRLCNHPCEWFRPPRFLKNAVRRGIASVTALLQHVRRGLSIGDRVDNREPLRSNKGDGDPCA